MRIFSQILVGVLVGGAISGASTAGANSTSWVTSDIPKADSSGWVTLFDGNRLFGCDPSRGCFTSGAVIMQDGALLVSEGGCVFDWKVRNAAIRARVKKVTGQAVSLHIGPYWCLNKGARTFYVGRGQNIQPGSSVANGKAANSQSDFFEVELSVHGGKITLMVDGVNVVTAQTAPLDADDHAVMSVSSKNGAAAFARIHASVLGEDSPPGEAPKGAGTALPPPRPPASSQQSSVSTLSQQAPNAITWALAPLEQSVPDDIRQSLTYLREDLLDEGKLATNTQANAYNRGYQLCNNLIAALDEREKTAVRAGYRAAQADANIRVTSQALEARRNYKMSWPQYAREQSQRSEIQRQQNSGSALIKESVKVEWSNRASVLRRTLDDLYAKYREDLRQSIK